MVLWNFIVGDKVSKLFIPIQRDSLSLSRNSWNFLNFSFQRIFFYFPCEYFFVDLFVFSVYISEKLATNWNKIFPWIHFTASQQWCFLLNIQQWNILSRLQHSLSLTYKTSTPYYKFWMKNVKIVNGKWDRKRPHELSNPR